MRPLGAQLEQAWARVKAGGAAVITRERVTTYKEFHDEATVLARGLAARAPVRSVVALLGSPGPELLALVAAGQLAGCEVALLDPTSPGSLARQLAALAPDLLVVGDGADRPAAGDLEVVSANALRRAGLKGAGAGERRSRWRDPAVLLPFADRFAEHSHAGVAAMAKALTSFIATLESCHFACDGPLHRWDIFAFVMTALLSGRAIVFDPNEAAAWTPSEAYGALTWEQADAIVSAGKAPRYLGELQLLFVVMSKFDVAWRRRLENILERVVLPIWGTPQTGPAVAAHPSWAPLEVHGLPLTNVTLLPLNPANGRPSDVPWEMLDRAELGIESPSVPAKERNGGPGGALFEWRGAAVARTGAIVKVDQLGMVRFLDAGR
jgi:hypothetical protein